MPPGATRTPPANSRWWAVAPLLTFGVATFALVLVAGVRLHDRRTQWYAAGYFTLLVAFCVGSQFIAGQQPGVLDAVMMAGVLVNWLVGPVHVFLLQQRLAAADQATAQQDPAILAARRHMARRQEALQIAGSDPSLARELKIGRPDVAGREYDDGGLVDVNQVPAKVLVTELGFPADLAENIVTERERRGGFESADEMLIYCSDVTPDHLEPLRDRLVFLPR